MFATTGIQKYCTQSARSSIIESHCDSSCSLRLRRNIYISIFSLRDYEFFANFYIYYIGELLKSLLQTLFPLLLHIVYQPAQLTPQKIAFQFNIMKNNDLSGKTTLSKSRSMSIMIKEKISIALGKPNQNRGQGNTKTTHTSYLSKERSTSLKSLCKTKNNTSKNGSQLIQKLSFYQQTPIKPKYSSLNESRKQQTERLKTTLSSHQNQNYIDHQTINSVQKFDEILWIDSLNRKFKIVNKKVQTLGQQARFDRCVEYFIGQDQYERSLFKIEGERISLVNKDSHIYWAKYDAKSGAIERLNYEKTGQTLKLNFDGFIFLYLSIQQKQVTGKQILSFLVQQIDKLKVDGLEQFAIISKIIRRLFEEKYHSQVQNFYLFLMKVQKISQMRKQKVLDTQKLILQKLNCIDKLTGTRNTKSIGQSLFNRNKFIE